MFSIHITLEMRKLVKKKKVEKKERKSFNKMSFISGNNKEKLQIESQTYLTGTASPLT